ncbi:conidiation protein Con-6 [Aspergillus sclerotialis]|uniref:Conidiation protein Con-6 n=1 Tax=Aspergillus sclerotialis TaxID=2070753 RepID=A0A3A2ZJA9_9EURO|nr:conidiation protein Con-6 [Aspergillus sclerotialis]
MSNPNNSDQAKLRAQQELSKLEGQPQMSEDERHAGNVKRGLTAATHNPNVTDAGKKQARDKLEAMGEKPDQPGD